MVKNEQNTPDPDFLVKSLLEEADLETGRTVPGFPGFEEAKRDASLTTLDFVGAWSERRTRSRALKRR